MMIFKKTILFTFSVLLAGVSLYGQGSESAPPSKKDSPSSPNIAELQKTTEPSEVNPQEKKSKAKKLNQLSINKANEIIYRMRNSDPGAEQYINVRLGVVQILSNTTGLETSPDKTLLTTGVDSNIALWGNLYLDLTYTKHSNSINPSNFSLDSTSLADLFQESTDIGLKYRFIIDETKPSNYLGVSLKIHNTTNNFKVADGSTGIIITQYDGMVLGVEKGIPITPNLGIDASLDMITINQVKESSDFTVANNGVGFVVKGEIYYTDELFGHKFRAGMAYWQSGMVNEFSTADRELFDRQNQVQTYRMITGSLGYVF